VAESGGRDGRKKRNVRKGRHTFLILSLPPPFGQHHGSMIPINTSSLAYYAMSSNCKSILIALKMSDHDHGLPDVLFECDHTYSSQCPRLCRPTPLQHDYYAAQRASGPTATLSCSMANAVTRWLAIAVICLSSKLHDWPW
jgi:hypothetical protein